MSGGQRQAVACARAIAFGKRIVILDEPTSALGARESGNVLRLIGEAPEHGVSVIVISHNLEHVMKVAAPGRRPAPGPLRRRGDARRRAPREARGDDRRQRRRRGGVAGRFERTEERAER